MVYICLYSVMGVAFVPKTHLLFTCGKDGTVKQWDADTYNHVTTLTPTHHAEVGPPSTYPTCGKTANPRTGNHYEFYLVLIWKLLSLVCDCDLSLICEFQTSELLASVYSPCGQGKQLSLKTKPSSAWSRLHKLVNYI